MIDASPALFLGASFSWSIFDGGRVRDGAAVFITLLKD